MNERAIVHRAFLIAGAVMVALLFVAAFSLRLRPSGPAAIASSMGAEFLGTERVTFQSAMNDCGPAALTMLLNDRGAAVTEEELLSVMTLSEHGATMQQMADAAQRYGVMLTGWSLNADDLPSSQFPMILLLRRPHYIVADSVRDDMVFIRDPSVGRMRIAMAVLKKVWEGNALVLTD